MVGRADFIELRMPGFADEVHSGWQGAVALLKRHAPKRGIEITGVSRCVILVRIG
jgi:hypothetical protein